MILKRNKVSYPKKVMTAVGGKKIFEGGNKVTI